MEPSGGCHFVWCRLQGVEDDHKLRKSCQFLSFKEFAVRKSVERTQDPLEAILVIFGRSFLIFLKVLEKMKNDTTFVRMRSSDHLGDAKTSKKGNVLHRI